MNKQYTDNIRTEYLMCTKPTEDTGDSDKI